jgi:adenylate cyclase
MEKSSLGCHNVLPESTKRDWKEGDVRGVLEIIRPLANDEARTRAGLRGTFVTVAVVSVALLGLSVLVLLAGNRRRR